MPEKRTFTDEHWRKTRHGAWAGRGFHFQYLISTLILVRQWVGAAPIGFLVPEGLEDCALELEDQEIWLQIKSRKQGSFSSSEAQSILNGAKAKSESVMPDHRVRVGVVMERTDENFGCNGFEAYFSELSADFVVCDSPEFEITKLLKDRLQTAEIIAEGITSDLYKLIADVAAQNAALPFAQRRRISTTEVERRIFERLEAEDPSAIHEAQLSGKLLPVDFATQVDEPAFYLGVKTEPGHIAAGLVLERPEEMRRVISCLKNKRRVLISAPSGAGKSSLMWLSANALAGEFRWFHTSSFANATDANSIIRFVRSRRPVKASPIALVVDDVRAESSDLWDVLVRELSSLPDVYLLGSIRQEDRYLVSKKAEVEVVEINLGEELAESIWNKLSSQGSTTWTHWKEPYEQSNGLLLEYVHILTQGQRLSALINEQVETREKDGRLDELAILRCSSALSALGGEIEVAPLLDALRITPDIGNQALKRLIDEHLVHESRPGVLGGLHPLRSRTLRDATHNAVFLTENSVWTGLLAVSRDTLPQVIRSVLCDTTGDGEAIALQKLADILAANHDIELWIAILTGLGQATLERDVLALIETLEQHGVQRAHWFLVSMFYDVNTTLPSLSDFEHWQQIENAVEAFRALPKPDLRASLINVLPAECAVPTCKTLVQANRLMSCIAPFGGRQPISVAFEIDFSGAPQSDIQEIAAMLSTAYLIEPEIAEKFVAAMGGKEELFEQFGDQTAWVSKPVTEVEAEHGQTVRANYFYVSDQAQPDPHKAICEICETLIALSPQAAAAASDAIDPGGRPIKFGDFRPWSKNMPRENIPAKARVAWNVAFRQIFMARAAVDTLTDYTREMSDLVRRTEKVFRSFTEKWIAGKAAPLADKFADEINDITHRANHLAYAAPENPSPSMVTPGASKGADDPLGAVLTGILGNLTPRMGRIPSNENSKSAAAFAGDLAEQAIKQCQSGIWRTIAAPPIKELAALSERLADISAILHEFAYDASPETITELVKTAKKGSLGRAIASTARRSRTRADHRLQAKCSELKKGLGDLGQHFDCYTRKIDDWDTPYWPPVEISLLAHITDFETDAGYLEASLTAAQQHLEQDWQYTIAPVMDDKVIASFAMRPSSQMLLPDLDFAKKWSDHIPYQCLMSEISEAFDSGLAACTQISAIVNCRDIENLHPIEEETLSGAIDTFKEKQDVLRSTVDEDGPEIFLWALDYMEQTWNRIVEEFETLKSGSTVESPLCLEQIDALSGIESQSTAELAGARMLLRQAESHASRAQG
ncbi:hypothetical protein [Roseibium alexandrii]|uniref:hypothetical protein n=1 Tax=Roseibium alexandrii TaxID=388408 RepID=UPI003751B3B2